MMTKEKANRLAEKIGTLIGILIALGIATWFWNRSFPKMFALPTINFWDMFGLYFIVQALTQKQEKGEGK